MAADFLEVCDGLSIGSNDLLQLTLGVDRDSGLLKGAQAAPDGQARQGTITTLR
jgi:pyruvate,water dikinase